MSGSGRPARAVSGRARADAADHDLLIPDPAANVLSLALPDGTPARLLPQGALYLPGPDLLVVADAHFGKAATFRARGVPVPLGTTRGTLARLDAALAASAAGGIVFLGDLFHAREAHAADTLAALRDWRQRRPALRLMLVEGNHDRHAGALPSGLAIEVVQEPWPLDALALCHHPQQVEGRHVLAGHLHPCVWLRDATAGVRLPCFWLRRQMTLLPAFGEFTGGAPITREDGDTVVAMADGRLFRLPACR
jgi:DNA ligase-associated metallophosphoesterase